MPPVSLRRHGRTYARFRGSEQREARGETVEEVAPADRADLTRAERARDRQRTEQLVDAGRRRGRARRSSWRPRPLQVNRSAAAAASPASISRRSSSAAAASRTWNCTVWPTVIVVADHDRAGRLVAAEHVAHEEVAALEVDVVLVDDDAEVQARAHQRAVLLARLPRRSPGRVRCAALPASSSIRFPSPRVITYGLPDRPTALGHHGADGDPVEEHADRTARRRRSPSSTSRLPPGRGPPRPRRR